MTRVADIVTYEPTRPPTCEPWVGYLGRRWIVTHTGLPSDRLRAVALDGALTVLVEATTQWRVLETTTHTPVPEPLPTVRGSVIHARYRLPAPLDALTDPMLALLVDPPSHGLPGQWRDEAGEIWTDRAVVADGPDYRVVSLPRSAAVTGADLDTQETP